MLYAFSFNAAFEKTVSTVYKGTRHDYLKTTWKCVALNNKMTFTNSTKVYKKIYPEEQHNYLERIQNKSVKICLQ